jgi:tetratricopeptide (TPR) repeat protein
MDARRRASTERAQQAVADQREANKTIPAPAGIPPEQRARSFRHGTIHGVGEMQLPPPPRMPEFGPKPKPAPAPAQAAQPASNKANPHAKTLPPPGTGTVTGLPGLKPHQTLYGTPNTQPEAHPTSGVPTGSTHPMANRASERPPSALPKKPEQAPEPTRQHLRADEVELPKPTSEPERFPQFKAVPAQRAPSAPPRKLYLDADEKAPPRATEGSRAWLYVALLLLAAGGGGWFGMTRLRVSGKAALQPAPEAPRAIANDAADAAASAIEPGPSDAPAENAGPSGAAPPEKTAAPFAPPVPELEEELARRTGERPDKTAPPEAEAPKPEAKPVPAKPEQAAASKPEKAAAAPAEKPVPAGKLDRLARAERAAAANPQDYSAQLNRADALFAKGDNEGAQQAYRQALALRPTGSEANSGMGFALLKDGKASDSLPFFDRAANSGYAEANIGLGDAYRVLGQPSSAKEAYQAYLERLPTGARAEYARTWLDKLSGGSGNKAPERGAEPETYRPAGELTQPPQ